MKFLKITAYIILGLLLLVVVGAGIFVATFDAEHYKPLITDQVQQHTGRELSLGEISPTLFPWLGIELKKVYLVNARGYKNEHMLGIERVQARLAIVESLLAREVRIDTVHLDGFALNLEKNKAGVPNWQDILDKQAAKASAVAQAPSAPSTPEKVKPKKLEAEEASTGAAGLLASLQVNGLEVSGARISWLDQAAAQQVILDDVNLTTGRIALGETLPVELSSRVSLSKPKARFTINYKADIDFDLDASFLQLNNLKLGIKGALAEQGLDQLTIDIDSALRAQLDTQAFVLPELIINLRAKGKAVPAGDISVRIVGRGDVDLGKQQANIPELELTSLGVTVKTRLKASGILGQPKAQGKVQIISFNPQQLTQKLNIALPPMASKSALTQAEMELHWKGTADSLNINPLIVNLDQSKLKGQASVKNFARPDITYALQLNQINLDHYLPEAVQEKTPRPAGKASAKAKKLIADVPIELPLEPLRQLTLQGEFKADTLQGFKQTIKGLSAKTTASQGQVELDLNIAEVLQGAVAARVKLDVRQAVPRYRLGYQAKQLKADSVVNPILQGLVGVKQLALQGAANSSLDLQTRGTSVAQLVANSQGKLSLNMGRSSLHGVDVEYFVYKPVEEYLLKKNLSVPEKWKSTYKPKDKTALKRVRFNADIKQGVITNKDLLVDASRFKVTGSGNVNLPTEKINYRVIADLQPAHTKTVAERLLDIPVPVDIKGRLLQPQIKMDSKTWSSQVAKAIKVEVKKKTKAAVKKAKKKQTKKLKKKVDKKLDKAKDKLKDKFKGLF